MRWIACNFYGPDQLMNKLFFAVSIRSSLELAVISCVDITLIHRLGVIRWWNFVGDGSFACIVNGPHPSCSNDKVDRRFTIFALARQSQHSG